jgi:putative phage-type endonuclease
MFFFVCYFRYFSSFLSHSKLILAKTQQNFKKVAFRLPIGSVIAPSMQWMVLFILMSRGRFCFSRAVVIKREMQESSPAKFIKVELDQSTDEWLSWRRGGIGASDAPVVMGLSPWQTDRELLLLKTGQQAERSANGAMQRGKALEPVARRAYVSHTRIEVEPVCVQSREHSWMRASLDGLSADGRHVVEIKCPGEKDHRLAASGCVPEKYFPQLQHILAVTGLGEIYYWSFRFDHTVLLKIERDETFIANLIEREAAFWTQVCAISDGRAAATAG